MILLCNQLIKVFIIMTILVLIFGTLLHFTYDWSKNNSFVGIFSAVNESTWEHLKLSFFPMLIFGIISYFFIKGIANNFIEGITIGILVNMIFIVLFFYGYQAILGRNVDFLNILDFILGVIIGELSFYKVVSMEDSSSIITKVLCLCILVILFICFLVFTYFPLGLEIFRTP